MKLNIGDFIKMKEEDFICKILEINDDNYLVKHMYKNDLPNFTVWFEEIDKKATKKASRIYVDITVPIKEIRNEEYIITEYHNLLTITKIEGEKLMVTIELENCKISQANKIIKAFNFFCIK